MLRFYGMQVDDHGVSHQVTTPTTPAASASDLQALLRLDESDSYLDTLLLASTEYAARYLSRSLITTEWIRQYDSRMERPELRIEYKVAEGLILPYGPVQSVDRVYTIDSDGDENETTDYYTDLLSQPGRVFITGSVWGREIAMLRIEYTAGYGSSATDVPAVIRQGILQHAAYMYEHRGDCSAEQAGHLSGAHGIYGSYRVMPR